MAIGRPTKPLEVTPEEREKLTMLARRPKSAQAMAMRARIVLGCEEGLSNGTVAKKLHITGATVCKWRERFRVNRLEGLLDEPRPGAPRSITDKQVEEVVTRTLESMPENSTHWSSRLMAQKTGLSYGFGVPSDCSHIVWRNSSSPKIRSSWKKCETSLGCI
jgi:transposase